MALVEKHYSKKHPIRKDYFQKQMHPEFYFPKSEISNSKLSLDYTSYPETYKSQTYKYIDKNDKEKCFENDIDGILLDKCSMTIQNSLSSLVLPNMYSSENCHIFPSTIRPETLDPSFMVQNFIDPQLFSNKDVQEAPTVSHEIQLLSPPYSSVQYDKNFVNNLDSSNYRNSDQENLRLLTGHCSQLQDDFKDSIHQLSSQMFSPPMSPQSNTVLNPENFSQDITCLDKPSFNQFMVTVSFDKKNQHTMTSLNGIMEKSTTFGRFSSRRTMMSLEAISSFIQGPEKSDGKFVCLYNGCLKRFGRKYNIQSHIQTHLSDRPYCCPVCRSRFVRHHDLKRHIKIHGDQKPYVCPCGKSFVRTDALKRHRIRGICKGSIYEKKNI